MSRQRTAVDHLLNRLCSRSAANGALKIIKPARMEKLFTAYYPSRESGFEFAKGKR